MAGLSALLIATLVGVACHRFFWRPAAFEPALDCSGGQSRKSNPLGQRAGDAGRRNPTIATAVPGLLNAGNPADIARRIGAVVVDAVQCVLGCWPVADRISECHERRLPSFVHLDPAPAVVRERRIAWVRAALSDLAPDAVQRCVRQAVRREQAFAGFLDQASTASGFRNKRRRADNGLTAAVAAAEPPNAVPSGVDRFDDEFAESHSTQVFECSHAQALYSSTGVKQNG
jgi:hypothetical protein